MEKVHYSGLDTVVNGVSIRKMKKWLRHQLAVEVRACTRCKVKPAEEVYREAEKTLVEVKPAVLDMNLSSSQRLVYDMQAFMGQEYELRFNELRGEVEFRVRSVASPDFHPVGERDLNSMVLRAQEAGLGVWDRDIKRFVCSDRIETYNPVDDFLSALPRWDGKERIRALADLVPTKNRQWRDRFHTWFLSMVAHWQGMDMRHGNCSLPLLSGEQGCGKSTWCLNLLPPQLREFYTDSIDLGQRSEVERYLNRFLLVNIDEFDSISMTHQAFLKHILQKPVVHLRRPHQQAIRQMRRYASFVGTCNHFDLLGDTSGSRRFLCVEVTGQIRQNEEIDYLQLYAEALHALASGERYWFTREEEWEITGQNDSFQQMPPAEQLFLRYFRPAVEGEMSAERLSAVEILQRIQKRASIKLPPTTLTFFGRLLLRNKVGKVHTQRGNLYWVAEVA